MTDRTDFGFEQVPVEDKARRVRHVFDSVAGKYDLMKRSRELGMQTFDQSLFGLYEEGLISYEDALRNADSLNDLRLEIKLHGKEAKGRNVFSGIGNLDIVPEANPGTRM